MIIPAPEEQKYNPRFVLEDFAEDCQPMIRELSCPLCKGILFIPVVDHCGHMYCKECYEKYYVPNRKCPVNPNEVLTCSEPRVLEGVQRIIETKIVKCRNRERGCQWTGPVKDFQEHQEKFCKKQLVGCPNKDCHLKFMRENFEEHTKNCEYREEECEDCHIKLPYKKLGDHHTICPKFKLPCPQRCGMIIMREEISSHCEEVCENSTVGCPYRKIGCEATFLRKELNKHIEEYSSKHMICLFESIQDFKKEMISLIEKKIEDIETKIELDASKYKNDKVNEIFKIGESIPVQFFQKNFLNNKRGRKESDERVDSDMKRSNNENCIPTSDNSSPQSSEKGENRPEEQSRINSPPAKEVFQQVVPRNDDFIFYEDLLPQGIIIQGNVARCARNAKTEHRYVFVNKVIDCKSKEVVEWKIIPRPTSVWLAFGVCDKSQVAYNNMKFFNSKQEFQSGTFCISTNGYSWNGNLVSENNKNIQGFPRIYKNEVITFRYYPEKRELRYDIAGNFKGALTEVYPTKSNLLTACIVFLHKDDEVEVDLNNDI